MKQLNEFQNLDDFLEYRFSQTSGKALVNDTQECSWEELRVKIATFIEDYKSIADITKIIPLVLHGNAYMQLFFCRQHIRRNINVSCCYSSFSRTIGIDNTDTGKFLKNHIYYWFAKFFAAEQKFFQTR